MRPPLSGVFVVAVSPLDERREFDLKDYRRLIEYCVAAKVGGLTVLGESAERDLLSDGEKQEILAATFEMLGGRLPIVVGTGSESTESTVRSSIDAQDSGASAVMIAPPRRLRVGSGSSDSDAIFEYFSSVGDRIEIPIVVQDFPQLDRPRMDVDLIRRLNAEISNAQYLKLEDPPTPLKMERLRSATGDRLKVFSAYYGRDSYWDLVHGAVGVMTSSPTPEYLVAMYDSFAAGDRGKALDIYLGTLPLVYYCSELGLAVRKEVLAQRGVIRASTMKQSEKELTGAQKNELRDVIAWVEDKLTSSCGVPPLGLEKAR